MEISNNNFEEFSKETINNVVFKKYTSIIQSDETPLNKINLISNLIGVHTVDLNRNFTNIDHNAFFALSMIRYHWTKNYMWSLANEATIDGIFQTIKSKANANITNLNILSYGCGTGFLEKCFEEKGYQIIGYDTNAEKYVNNYIDIKLSLDFYNDDVQATINTLLLAWPRGHYACEALEIFKGTYVIYIGEVDGCNAGDDFFDMINESYDFIGNAPLQKFSGIRDEVLVYKRKNLL